MQDWEREVMQAQKEELQNLSKSRDAALDALGKARASLEEGVRILSGTLRALELEERLPVVPEPIEGSWLNEPIKPLHCDEGPD